MGTTRLLILTVIAVAGGCSERPPTPKQSNAASTQPNEPSAPTYAASVPPAIRAMIDRTFTGDMDAMIQRRIIRAGVPFNRTFYFIDKGQQRGLSYEYLTLFEDQLNKRLKTGNLKIHIVLLPMPRDMLLPSLQAGKLDMVVAQLTITPERQKLVDFTNPTRTHVSEIVVTAPGTAAIGSLQDLSGRKVFARKSSSYYASLQALNSRLKAAGKPPVDIEAAPENLEDDDLLEMVNAGLIPATAVDDYLADYWKQVFPNLSIHHDLALRTGGNLAVAIRKNTPKFAAALNAFIAQFGLNSVTRRILDKRYLQSTSFVKDAASVAERKKFLEMASLFRKYGAEYDFDYLLMAAQGYQESRLDPDAKSRVGAIGVMQVMPETGKEQEVGDIHLLEPNIHAGVKYMRFMRNQYFQSEPMDDLNKGLFTFASYNAGAGRIRQLRREAAQRGLNPNIWFGNVERLASERIGRETVTYVSNIYKYYIAYRLITEERERRAAAKTSLEKGSR